jgi:hypothetical protein
VKIHLSFATTSLGKSIEFYSMLLNAAPAKVLPDYALFITDQPPLELALNAAEAVTLAADAHYGIFVETTQAAEHAIARLQNAGLACAIEREQTCCYANQTKVWATDPTGRRWEIYTVHEETEEGGSPDSTCCADADDACCA